MNKLWIMVAHYHGQTVNFSDIGRSLDISDKSIKRYLEILCGSFMVRLLKPWHENLSKRQVKSPKVYIRDSGLFHTLLNLTPDNWLLNPKIGASWEGYALEEVLRFLNVTEAESYFWATEKGAELDLLVLKKGQKLGFEFKYSDAPKVTRSMHIALEDLKLETLTIIIPGNNSYQLAEKIFVSGLLPFINKKTLEI
jgi:predicted AAA+ superfamily ATPase